MHTLFPFNTYDEIKVGSGILTASGVRGMSINEGKDGAHKKRCTPMKREILGGGMDAIEPERQECEVSTLFSESEDDG